MATFASTQNTGNLKKFIQEIPTRGTPEKVTIAYLEGLGYKSKNDRSLLPVLKFMGVLDGRGVPTDVYKELRSKGAAKTIARQTKNSYSDLFKTYPDADKKDSETLKDWFTSKTNVGAGSIRNILTTFSTLCDMGDFDSPRESEVPRKTASENPDDETNTKKTGVPRKKGGLANAEIYFNIQIHIPGEQEPDVYESIFKNLGKYVLGIRDDE